MSTGSAAMPPSSPGLSAITIPAPSALATATSPVTTPSSVASSTATCEPALRIAVREALWPIVVCQKGSRNFGLEQRSLREGETHDVGGWLRKVKHRGRETRQFGEAQYFVLDDAKEMFCLIKQDEVKDFFLYRKIVSVTAHMEGANDKKTFFFRVVGVTGGEQKIWELSPGDTSDRQLVVNWTAALQIRSKTYDVVLDLDHEKALKVALWCQSLYRGFRGRLRADRIRAKREAAKNRTALGGIQRMVSGLFTTTAGTLSSTQSSSAPVVGAATKKRPSARKVVDDTSSDDEDEEDEDEEETGSQVNPAGALEDGPESSSPTKSLSSVVSAPASMSVRGLFTSFRRNVFRERGLTMDDQLIPTEMPALPPLAADEARSCLDPALRPSPTLAKASSATGSTTTTKHVRFPSDRSLVIARTMSTSSPGGNGSSPSSNHNHPGTVINIVEDEIWENQRWSAMAMRGTQVFRGWSDVALLPTERGAFSDRLGKVSWFSMDAVPVPKGWKLAKDWTLDLTSSKCNSEGWHYAQTFASIDSNLASGRSNFSVSARWLVRTRRWYRIREKEASTDLTDSLMLSGWLGMRGITTGRWTNNFTFLPKRRAKEHLGIALCYFKKSARVFNEDLSFRYDFNSPLHSSKIKVKYLDNLCVVSDASATRDQPGLFTLHLSGEAEPRLFNAHSAEARIKWVQALSSAISESPGPCYEAIANRRSMRKGAAWELLRASGAVKDLVGGGVRGVKAGFLTMAQPLVAGQQQPFQTGQHSQQPHRRGSDLLHRMESDPDMPQVQSLREEYRRNDAVWGTVTSAPRKFSTDSVGSTEFPSAAALPMLQNKRSSSLPFTPSGTTTTARAGKTLSEMVEGPTSTSAAVTSDTEGENVNVAGEDDANAPPPSTTNKAMRQLKMLPKKLLKPARSSSSLSSTAPATTTGESSGGEISPSPPCSGLFPAGAVTPLRSIGEEGTALLEFKMPPPYENIMFDGHFDMSADDFDTLFFREEEFTRDILAAEKMTDIELEPWTNGLNVGSEHRRRYRMPRVGVVPPGPSFHLLTRSQTVVGKGYVVDQVCSTPEMPFGQNFSTDFRNVIVADGPKRCRVIISQRVTLFKTLMAQSFIKSGTKREIMAYYKNVWPGFVRKWILQKRRHLLSSEAAAAGELATTNTAGTATEVVPQQQGEAVGLKVQEESEHMRLMKRIHLAMTALALCLVVFLIIYVVQLTTRIDRLESLLVEINSKLAASSSSSSLVSESTAGPP